MSKIGIVSDVHCSSDWKQIKFDIYDKVIFVGDYFDSFEPILRKKALDNMKEIIKTKHKYNNIILLLGNHDLCQYMLRSPISGKDKINEDLYNKFLINNAKEFDIVSQAGKYLVSHAGVSKTWCNNNKIDNPNTINKLYHEGNYSIFDFNGIEVHGDDITQGPLWIRPKALCSDLMYPYQIVGHTPSLPTQPFMLKNENCELIIIDGKTNCYLYELEITE